MRKNFFAILCLILAIGVQGQDIEVYDSFEDFRSSLIKEKDKFYVVNYWATWCAPCIKELPYFEQLNKVYQNDNVEVVLVSIDFKNQYERRLKPFVKEKALASRLIHMADPKANTWIPKIDEGWSGAIPVTEFFGPGGSTFVGREFTDYQDLKDTFESFKKNINP